MSIQKLVELDKQKSEAERLLLQFLQEREVRDAIKTVARRLKSQEREVLLTMALKAVELIVSGEVQGVGYRGFVTRIARKLKLVGFAENVEDGTVRIHCKGEAASIEKFKELINVKNPSQAPLIEVEALTEKPLGPEAVAGAAFKEKFGELTEEMSQWQTTGMNYLNAGFNKMDANFGVLADKYGKISTTMDHIDKNIDKMATKKKGIFE